MPRPNKLECLYLVFPFKPSLTFAGNTRILPKTKPSGRSFTWVGLNFASKFLDQTGKAFQGQTL